MTTIQRPQVLVIAGLDPCGGAGLLADTKTMEALGVYAMGVVSCNTIQNESEFEQSIAVDFDTVAQQITVLGRLYHFGFAKIGLVPDLLFLQKTVHLLVDMFPEIKIVWDPVLKATAAKTNAYELNRTILADILPHIYLLTPNLDEAEIIFGASFSSVITAHTARTTHCNVLLKGGHATGREITDVLFTRTAQHRFSGHKFDGYAKHGTGCILSSAIVAALAQGKKIPAACGAGKYYVEQAILSNKSLLAYHSFRSNSTDFS